MKITGIWLQHYGSFYGRHYLALGDRGLVAVFGDNQDDPRQSSNGAGKSTLGEALDWCLFGEPPKRDVAFSVVNEEAGKDCCVTVQIIDDDGNILRITRLQEYTGYPNGPRLYVNGEDHTALDASETQRKIEDRLGLDIDLFRAVVHFQQQRTFNFADAKDSERKEILTKVIPELGEVDRMQQRVVDHLPAAKLACDSMRDELERRRHSLERLRVDDPSPRLSQWETERQADLQRHLQQLAQLHEQHAQACAEHQALPLVPDVTSSASVPPPAGYSEARTREGELQKQIKAVSMELGGKRAEASRLKAVAEELVRRREGPCSACGQLVTGDHLARERSKIDTEYAVVVEQGHEVRGRHDALQAEATALSLRIRAWEEEWAAAKQQAAVQRETATTVQRHRTSLEQRIRTLGTQVQGTQAAVDRIRAMENPWHQTLVSWRESLEREQREVATREEQLPALERRLNALAFWRDGLGAKGLKSYILDGKVAEMTQEANRWVQLLTGGTVWVEFATQREVGTGKKRKLVEDLTLRVIKSHADGTITRRNYRSYSGGEGYRIALGVDFGLARLVARRARRAYDLLFLDEVFQKSLDRAGKEAVAELLFYLSQEKSSVYVVDHDLQFQHIFAGQLNVLKKNRRSRIVGGLSYGVVSEEITGMSTGQLPNVLKDHPAFPS